jgi:hypothetical protein
MKFRVYIHNYGKNKIEAMALIRRFATIPLTDVVKKIGSDVPIFEGDIPVFDEYEEYQSFIRFLINLEELECEHKIQCLVTFRGGLLQPNIPIERRFVDITRDEIQYGAEQEREDGEDLN